MVFFVLGWITHPVLREISKGSRTIPIREDSPKYHYINPLVLIDNSSIFYEELNPLKTKVAEYINKEIHSRQAERASFYFRNVDSSIWTGVNQDDKFVPSSILKIATMMAYLRIAEGNPVVMSRKLRYQKSSTDKQNYPPDIELEDGYYSIGQLLGQSIIESDNTAERALSAPVLSELTGLYKVLRLPLPPAKLNDYMSPRDVSNMFRALYSSTYLLNTYSEQVLEFLTRTNFVKGITQGVDPSIKIAHKFGEHTIYYPDYKGQPDYQLHDCGIVYYPGKPYFICIMTEGKNLSNLESIIGNISSIVFEYVKKSNF